MPGERADTRGQRSGDQRQRRLPAARAPGILPDEARPGRSAAGDACHQQQRVAREGRYEPLTDEQPVRLIQLRLFEEHQPDV